MLPPARSLLSMLMAIVLSALAGTGIVRAQSPDSAAFAALGRKLDSYMDAMADLSAREQGGECSFLISSCTDSLVRQYVTLYLYSHYVSSAVMGAEAVAVDIFDKWIADGKVKMKSDVDLMNARIFADFNRMSLVGKKTPEVTLRDTSGASVTLFSGGERLPRYAVLYFYDTGCSSCLAQTVLLRTWLDGEVPYPLDVYAVYTGQDETAWETYRNARFSRSSASVRMHHLWDPDSDADFQRKFGVLQTPQMLLVGKDNVILGRKLDVPALAVLLEHFRSADSYEYGSEASAGALDAVFSTFGDDLNVSDVNAMSDRMAAGTSSDPAAFKEMMGDMFYWLAAKTDGRYREGARYLAEKYILSRPDVWDTAADSVKVVSYAETMYDLLSRALPGKPAPDVKLRGRMVSGCVPASVMAECGLRSAGGGKSRSSSGVWRLDRLKKASYVVFYDRGCASCRANIAAADTLMRENRKMRMLLVDVSDGHHVKRQDDSAIPDSFDLTVLPYILRVENGLVEERYVDFCRMERASASGSRDFL